MICSKAEPHSLVNAASYVLIACDVDLISWFIYFVLMYITTVIVCMRFMVYIGVCSSVLIVVECSLGVVLCKIVGGYRRCFFFVDV